MQDNNHCTHDEAKLTYRSICLHIAKSTTNVIFMMVRCQLGCQISIATYSGKVRKQKTRQLTRYHFYHHFKLPRQVSTVEPPSFCSCPEYVSLYLIARERFSALYGVYGI
jgi:hypothetical protein